MKTKKFQDARAAMIEKMLKELQNGKSLAEIRSMKARLLSKRLLRGHRTGSVGFPRMDV